AVPPLAARLSGNLLCLRRAAPAGERDCGLQWLSLRSGDRPQCGRRAPPGGSRGPGAADRNGPLRGIVTPMTVPVLCARDAERLLAGEPPVTADALIYLGWPRWIDFLRAEYLEGFIAEGGAKVKLVVGSPGSGKSHQLALAAATARTGGYLVAQVDARLAERVFPLDRLYGEVMRSVDLKEIVARLCGTIVSDAGY